MISKGLGRETEEVLLTYVLDEGSVLGQTSGPAYFKSFKCLLSQSGSDGNSEDTPVTLKLFGGKKDLFANEATLW